MKKIEGDTWICSPCQIEPSGCGCIEKCDILLSGTTFRLNQVRQYPELLLSVPVSDRFFAKTVFRLPYSILATPETTFNRSSWFNSKIFQPTVWSAWHAKLGHQVLNMTHVACVAWLPFNCIVHAQALKHWIQPRIVLKRRRRRSFRLHS